MSNYHAVLSGLEHRGYQAELTIVKAAEFALESDQDMAITTNSSSSTSYGLRVIKDHRTGTTVSSALDDAMVERAVRMARLSGPDKNAGLPAHPSIGTSEDNLQFKLGDSIEKVGRAISDLTDVPLSICGAIAKAGNYSKTIVSTEGVNASESRSAFVVSMGVYTNGRTPGPNPDIWDGRSSTRLDINVQSIKESLAEKVEIFKTVAKSRARYAEIVLTSAAATELLGGLLGDAFWGANLYWGRTPFRLGLDIRNPALSITEDPTVPYSTDSRVFDMEGQKRFSVPLVKDGVVQDFLCDSYWARRARRRYTASAGGPCNIVIGAREEKDVTQDVLVVHSLQGIHGIDPTTGRFSLNAETAWVNRNGRCRAVRGVTVSGDIVSLLRGIKATSREKRVDEAAVSGDLRIEDKGISAA